MTSKFYIASAVLLAMTTQAQAGPVYGGTAWQVNASKASTVSKSVERESVLSFINERFQLVIGITTGSVGMATSSEAEPSSHTHGDAHQKCTSDDHPEIEGENAKGAADHSSLGPEPFYFAF